MKNTDIISNLKLSASPDPSTRPSSHIKDSLVGLSTQEATRLLAIHGENRPQGAHKDHKWRDFFSRFQNPLVLILLGAAFVSICTGEIASSLIIFLIISVSISLDFFQQYRADQAVERLSSCVALNSKVIRDGKISQIPTRQIVPGDVVVLSAGDLIPADSVILEAKDFFLNQSTLTGECYPVEKFAVDEESFFNKGSTESPFHAFAGSSVISGFGKICVFTTGAKTFLGRISESLEQKRPETSFEIGVRQFGMLIMRFTFVLVVFSFAINVAFHRPLLESLLFGVALAVGLTPELLPMVITVTLTRGALEMAKAKVIVKRLSAVQDLGSMQILCTDKTGTLTEGRIILEKHVDVKGHDSYKVLQLAYANSFFETGLKNPLDEAILVHTEIDLEHWKKIDEVPFDFERRRVSVLTEALGQRLLIVKGAPENILGLCTQYEAGDAGEPEAISDSIRKEINDLFEDLAGDGFHVLGVAYRRVSGDLVHAVVGDESQLVFAGFAAFLDPPKASAADAIKALRDDQVELKVVSGDHDLVVKYVCDCLGIPVEGVLSGAEIEKMDDNSLRIVAAKTTIFCRVNPAQKTRIISALRAGNKTVGYLGDGINDASALHVADVGISVDTAVDVAKQAADLVLLEQDLRVLHNGIRAGRLAFANVQKYILMATSSNFGNMFSMALATVFLPFLPMLPIQILLNNLLYDLSELSLPTDGVDEEVLLKPASGDISFIRSFMLTIGPISSLFDFITFYILLVILKANEVMFHTGWFVESLATQILVIFVIRTKRPFFKSHPGRIVTVCSLSMVAIAAVLPYTSLAKYLGFMPLPANFFMLLALVAVTYLCVVEVVKQIFYRNLKLA